MLEWNDKWQKPSWEAAPKDAAADYVRNYASRAFKPSGVLGVWALVRGASLDVYTLIKPSRETERELHGIELELLNTWPSVPVRFHIYRNRETLLEQVAGAEPVLIAS